MYKNMCTDGHSSFVSNSKKKKMLINTGRGEVHDILVHCHDVVCIAYFHMR